MKLERYNLNSLNPWDTHIIAVENTEKNLSINEDLLLNDSFKVISELLSQNNLELDLNDKLVLLNSNKQLFNSFCSPLPYSEKAVLVYPSIKTINNLINYAHELGHALHYLLVMENSKAKCHTI